MASTPRRSPPRSTRACSRSASPSPRRASRAASRSRSASRARRRRSTPARTPARRLVGAGRRGPRAPADLPLTGPGAAGTLASCLPTGGPGARDPASDFFMAVPLRILARDPGSRARSGVLTTAHGEVRTPAFIPLATKATVKGLLPSEVAALGYDMVLGNTFHLFLGPGHELVARFGGLHRFMGWDGPIVTDSGGFQVFSMGHGNVAAEIKKTGGTGGRANSVRISERGVTFRSHLDGSERFMAPETSMEVQAALGSDLAHAFDE